MYRFCCDLGYAPEPVEKEQVLAGLKDFDVLLIPADDCYHAERDERLESALRLFAGRGGTVIHSAGAEAAEFAFDIRKQRTENTGYHYCEEGGLLSTETVYAMQTGEAAAYWCGSNLAAATMMNIGQGKVCSFGFMPGYQYIAKKAPHVPPQQRNNALYPFTHMEHNLFRDWLLQASAPDQQPALKDVECASFENGRIIVNHRSTPIRLSGQAQVLAGHSCVWIDRHGKEIFA